MIELYHCVNARSFRPLWAMEELGVPYDLKMLPFPPRVLAKPYLELNPLGTIPLLIDAQTRMTESSAMCEYLAGRYGPTDLAVGPDESAYGAYLNWMYYGEATLTFPQTLVLRYSQHEPETRRLPQIVEDYSRWFLARLRAVESRMAHAQFLCADRFTMADVSVGFALMLASDLKLDERFGPETARYWARLQARDGFQRALAAQEAGTPAEFAEA